MNAKTVTISRSFRQEAPPGTEINCIRVLKTAAALVLLGCISFLVNQIQEAPAKAQVTYYVPVKSVINATDKTIEDLSYSNITLDDVYISVKTSRVNHNTRLPIILKTWFQLAKQQTWFFTDDDSDVLQNETNGHIINTNCSHSHFFRDLCCKTAVEIDYFYASYKKWFCHFDDDNYVNVPKLLSVLQKCNYENDWYLGKISVYRPKRVVYRNGTFKTGFLFGTGGAGFCISKSLGHKLIRLTRYGNFMKVCDGIRMADDVTIGYIIKLYLNTKLTIVHEFHSHLEDLTVIPAKSFKDQITFSYGPPHTSEPWNVMNVSGFDMKYDPTRFLSLHCFLFPDSRSADCDLLRDWSLKLT